MKSPSFSFALARTAGAVALLVGAVTAGTVTTAAGDAGPTVQLRDECEPDSFNAALGPGACVGDGDVTFAELLATLTPAIGGHEDWRQRPKVEIEAGDALRARNRGGETHTFTEVIAFGTGIVPELNAALPAGTPPAIPVNGIAPLFSGASTTVSGLSVGTHRFMCMIHPWMRTTVKVSAS